MMKKISIVLAMIVLMSVSVLAFDFELHKYTVVTGDYLDTNGLLSGGWLNGVFTTAEYRIDAVSDLSKVSSYGESETLGTAWTYSFASLMTTSAATTSTTQLHAITLNDPATTSATGGYTQYTMGNHNYGDYTESHLSVTGQGYVDIVTTVNSDTGLTQYNDVTIN